jgi:hypothetical protein
MLPDYFYGPDEIDRLGQINRLAWQTENPTEEDFKRWDYFIYLVKFNKDNLLIAEEIECVMRHMIAVCPAYGDYQYKKLMDEKID